MKTRKFHPVFFLLLVVGLWCTAPTRAAIVINAVESGGDVVATLSGSINSLAGATLNQTAASAVNYNFARATDASFTISDQPNGTSSFYNNYDIPTYPANFGSGGNALATSSTASTRMQIRSSLAAQIWIAQDYVLGTAVTGDLTWGGTSFASLGWTEGTYVWSWAGDSVTLNIGGSGPGPAPVPEPGTWAAAALLAGGAAFMRWRKRAKVA